MPIARRSPLPNGRSRIRSCASSGTGSRTAGSEDALAALVEAEAAEAVAAAERFARESPFPPVELVAELVFADG